MDDIVAGNDKGGFHVCNQPVGTVTHHSKSFRQCEVFFLREYYKEKDWVVNKGDLFIDVAVWILLILKTNFNNLDSWYSNCNYC